MAAAQKIEKFTDNQKFQFAVAYVQGLDKNGEAFQATADQKLVLYGLYKQATMGDCVAAKPWFWQVEACLKWDAWMSRKGWKRGDARCAYVAELLELLSAVDSARLDRVECEKLRRIRLQLT